LSATKDLATAAVDEQLRRRLEHATARASEILGSDAAPLMQTPPGLPRAQALIARGSDRLAAIDPAAAMRLDDERQAALSRLHQRYQDRFDALARAGAAVVELREVTSPTAMLARAPAALCAGSTLQRVILSLVRGGRMVAEAVHFAGDELGAQAVLGQLRANPPRLEHPLIETELLRRRRATIVLDAHVHPRVERRLAELMDWQAYAVAPVLVGGRVIGVVHADRGSGQPLDVLDRDVLWEFTSGLAQAYESATLRRALRREREQMRQFLEWLGARSGELTDAPVTLGPAAATGLPAPQALDGPAATEGRDDRAVFEGLLTKRELEVLRLLAEGQSNRGIADALVISGATVKFHVASVLRKLHVANRAEAVARYLRLLGMRAP
jgi:LuxR family transcriptional regulator, regulator of acetate metabolism